jgi:hypothetical protein
VKSSGEFFSWVAMACPILSGHGERDQPGASRTVRARAAHDLETMVRACEPSRVADKKIDIKAFAGFQGGAPKNI